MDYRKIADLTLEKAKARFDEAEVFIESSEALSIEYYNKDLDQYELSEEAGFSITVRRGDLWAETYSEHISEDLIDPMLDLLEDNLAVCEAKPYKSLHKPEEGETLAKLPYKKAADMDPQLFLDICRTLADKTLDLTDQVRVVSSSVSAERGRTLIKNSLGLDREASYSYALVFNYVVMAQGDAMENGVSLRLMKDPADLDLDEMAREAVTEAQENFGGKSLSSGTYKVVLDRKVVASLMSAFASSLSADQVQKGMSLLRGKLGQKVGSSVLSLVDNPLHPEAARNKNFDGEGVAMEPTYLIRDGVLENYFYDIETAAKEGVNRKGNCRRSYKGSQGPGATCLVLETTGETKSQEELFREAGQGFYITSLQGLHSGLNQVSGDFSLPAQGFLIKDGKKDRPVNQVTVAGNLLELLAHITAVGSDSDFCMPNHVMASVLVDRMQVAGDEA